jgi:hypothetical protein
VADDKGARGEDRAGVEQLVEVAGVVGGRLRCTITQEGRAA